MATTPVANYPNEDQGPTILASTLTVTVLALISLAIRLFVRVRLIRNVGWDDYMMIVAMALCVTGQVLIIPEVKYGAGRHINHIPVEDFGKGLKYNFITQPIYLWAICMVKVSIGFFLLRVAATAFFRRVIISIMVFMTIYTLVCFFTIMFECTNLAVLWDSTVKATCFTPQTLRALSYTNVALNITTDILFSLIIPIPMLWNVQMNIRTKSSVIGVLALGVFATAAALVKTSFLPSYGKHGDWLWDSRNLTIWNVIESNIGIVAGNLPCMKPLFRRVLGSIYGGGSGNVSNNKYYGRGYAPGTGHSVNNYNSLGSRKTEEGYGAGPDLNGDEAHMMTRITVRAKSSASVDSVSKMSDESITRLEGSKMGITKTTTTKVAFAHTTDAKEEMTPERMAKHIV
ncbi:hypothetical protein K432DRAFT_59635 [Lepidopterella palustris CBS 459.81]|uniref:Rhodopsin domain-containing protein n=1 Tax=Lepidopterella palustris CBS 459.81 TaxID=1314670 RepID=A0A8E2E9I6_9PEZI|nr:hypothetical protein K432DRAFT_59635 [Lepidopterella palustris CBS 459.81]